MVLSGMPEPGTPVDRRHEEGRRMALRKPGVILVTGGASGIGAAMVRQFAAAGHQVAIADIDVAGGESVADATGGLFIRTDVSDFAANKAAVAQATERFGGLDAVCLNAGIGGGGPLVGGDFDPDRYHRVIQVNLNGVVYGLNAALPALRARGGGAILVTSSLAGIWPSPFDPYYAAAKHGLIGLTRSVAGLLYRESITLNAICPGFVDTPIIAAGRERLIAEGIALADPAQVAAAAADILESPDTGRAYEIQAGRPARQVPLPDIEISRTS
jgi:NAD(P)-dependent dehydrogenase (short-subunit alcohol dehydrogenase family)